MGQAFPSSFNGYFKECKGLLILVSCDPSKAFIVNFLWEIQFMPIFFESTFTRGLKRCLSKENKDFCRSIIHANGPSSNDFYSLSILVYDMFF